MRFQGRPPHGRHHVSAQREALAAESLPAADTAQTSEDAALREESGRLEHVIAQLLPEHRHVLRRVQFEGASYEVVGRELGRSPEAVRKLLARALGRISTLLRP